MRTLRPDLILVLVFLRFCCIAHVVECKAKAVEHRSLQSRNSTAAVRGALIVTLAGSKKLAPYFEWSCLTFGASAGRFDLLVFHEKNSAVAQLECPENVKFIDLGEKGLAKLLVNKILDGTDVNSAVKAQLESNVDRIITHIPRYLVEIKPMFGTLFESYLRPYSHWSYTDPDIIWGNLADWISAEDLQQFDFLSIGKNYDAGRLFLRGQLTFHHNAERINGLWKQLEYFNYGNFAERIASARNMIDQKRHSNEIFSRSFQSAEGWYSQLVFKSDGIAVKIVGRGFDDFYQHPVLWQRGRLTRCPLNANITSCLLQSALQQSKKFVSVSELPPLQMVDAQVSYDPSKCKMFWLPMDVRFCVTSTVYDKDMRENHKPQLRLQRVGEAVLEGGKWSINDEKRARRQVPEHAALFHFRHWDDVIATGFKATFPENKGDLDCMVFYINAKDAIAFETCDAVRQQEEFGAGGLLALQDTGSSKSSSAHDTSKLLALSRKANEVGDATSMEMLKDASMADSISRSISRSRSKRSSGGGGSSTTSSLKEPEKMPAGKSHLRGKRQAAHKAKREGSSAVAKLREAKEAALALDQQSNGPEGEDVDAVVAYSAEEGQAKEESMRKKKMAKQRKGKRSRSARAQKRMRENRKPHTGMKIDTPDQGSD